MNFNVCFHGLSFCDADIISKLAMKHGLFVDILGYQSGELTLDLKLYVPHPDHKTVKIYNEFFTDLTLYSFKFKNETDSN
ncbi:hypothetical protein [Nostoc phage N1]|nr:hypothetical protein [Nostoc phage N1]